MKGSIKRGWVFGVVVYVCACTELWRFLLCLVIWGKFVVEEVVTHGESVAVPIKGVEGSRFALPDSCIRRCVGARFRGGTEFLA